MASGQQAPRDGDERPQPDAGRRARFRVPAAPRSGVEPSVGPVGRVRPSVVLAAWAITVAVDLFFNAGIFSPLFDQAREPGLLDDATLFRRIPVAYLTLLVAVLALTWLVDTTGSGTARRGAALGAIAGAVAAGLGVVGLWTAFEITGLFVAAQALVQVCELAAAGAVLGAFADAAGPRARRRVTRLTYAIALLAVVLAIIAQNVLGTWSGS